MLWLILQDGPRLVKCIAAVELGSGKWVSSKTPPSKVGAAAAYISANENGNERTRILRLKIRLGLSWKRCVSCRLAAVSKTQFGFKAREFRVMVYYYTTLLLTIFMRRR